MTRGKGEAITFPEFPGVKITWGPHGRYTVKKDRIKEPVAFLAPWDWKWQLQRNPSLAPIGDPIEKREDALRNAAEYASKK